MTIRNISGCVNRQQVQIFSQSFGRSLCPSSVAILRVVNLISVYILDVVALLVSDGVIFSRTCVALSEPKLTY